MHLAGTHVHAMAEQPCKVVVANDCVV